MSKYKVWLRDEFEDASEDERADRAWPVRSEFSHVPELNRECRDVRTAAQWFADHCHSRLDGWEWQWPQEFVVFDGEQYFAVEVERHTVPEFEAGKPQPLTVSP